MSVHRRMSRCGTAKHPAEGRHQGARPGPLILTILKQSTVTHAVASHPQQESLLKVVKQ